MKYEFSLILTESEVTDEEADKLYAAGCDDASILTRRHKAPVRPPRRQFGRGPCVSHPECGASGAGGGTCRN